MYEGHGDGSGAGQRGFGVLIAPAGGSESRRCRGALWGGLRGSRVPTGGHKARPYRHAPGFLVGAGFIPARAGVRFAGGLRGSPLPHGRIYNPPLQTRSRISRRGGVYPRPCRGAICGRLAGIASAHCASQLPFTGEPLGRRISCSSNTTSSLFPGQKSFERI